MEGHDSVGLSEYAGMARRRWLTIVVSLIVGGALALAYLALAPKQYSATSTVVVYPITTDNFSQVNLNQTVNATTEASVVTSTSVAEQAAKLMGAHQSPNLLLQQVTAVGVPNTQTVTITYTDSTAAGAAKGANAFASAYLTTRAANATQQVQAVTTSMSTRILALEKQVAVADALVATTSPASAAYNDNLVQRQVVTQELIQLRQGLNSLSTLAVVPGQLVSQANAPDKPISPTPLIALAGGLAVGLFLATVLVYLRDRRDDRLRDAKQAESAANAPVLAVVPRPRRQRNGLKLGPVTAINHDDYRALVVKLAARHDGHIGCVAVIGVDEQPEGIVSAGLAAALAQTDARVALVVVGSAEPFTTLFNGVPARTIGEAAMDASASTVDPDQTSSLDVLIAPGANPIGPALSVLVDGLRKRYTTVIVMLPGSGNGVAAETLAWAQLTDVIVLAGSLHHTRASRFAVMVEQLGQVRALVTGCVLVTRHTARNGTAGPGPSTHTVAEVAPTVTKLPTTVTSRSPDEQLVTATE